MKVLTAAEMREVDRLTIGEGIPGLVLMENAGHRVMEFLERRFAPLASQRILVLCGKGNNGGDGLVIARQLYTRVRPRDLWVVLAADPAELKGDAAANWRMLQVTGCPVSRTIAPDMRRATIVVDALLGTGIKGGATGEMAALIREVNTGFPDVRVVAVDIPSGMASDGASSEGETVRAVATVTFTAPKVGMVLPPNCDAVGELVVGEIGSPSRLWKDAWLSVTEPGDFAPLFGPRTPAGHKGDYGHVLVIAGSRTKPGAAAMAGISALRAGAGLVTVASAGSAIGAISAHAMELMTEPLPETETGGIVSVPEGLLERKTALAVGPGLGTEAATVEWVRALVAESPLPMVLDADGLNALAGGLGRTNGLRVLTPHPGEMSRLTGKSTREVLAGRLEIARAFAQEWGAVLVLKGQRTLIAFPDGKVWVNPTGSPAMGTGGSGDVLTGLLAGLLAQFPDRPREAVLAAVWLHGRCGELGAAAVGEKALIATDLLRYLPEAMHAVHG